MSLSWLRKMLRYDLASRLAPDADSALVDALQRLCLDRRRAPQKHAHTLGVFHQFVHGANLLRNLAPLSNVLELGRGYSTVILAAALPPETRIFSVDGKPGEAIDIAPCLRTRADRVEYVTGFTVTRSELDSFYSGHDLDPFLGQPAADILARIPEFLRPAPGPYAATLALPGDGPDFLSRSLEVLAPHGAIRCLSKLFPEILPGEKRWSASGPDTALDAVLKEAPVLDAVIFDCGEFSSLLEWERLKDHIRPGGLALFHDIYFPKSVKNFLVCAALAADPAWDVLYQDRSTPQGYLAARRRA
jgi:predicted O-methyltransferase YrrM